MLTCKIASTQLNPPIIVNKNPGFRALHITGWIDILLFAINRYCFSFLTAGFCSKNLAYAQKMLALLDFRGGCKPQPPGSCAYE